MACAGGYHTCFLDEAGGLWLCGQGSIRATQPLPVDAVEEYNGHPCLSGPELLPKLEQLRRGLHTPAAEPFHVGKRPPSAGANDESKVRKELAEYDMKPVEFDVDARMPLPPSRFSPVAMFDCGRSGTVVALEDGSIYRLHDSRNSLVYRLLYCPQHDDDERVKAAWPVRELGGEMAPLPIVRAVAGAGGAAVQLLMQDRVVAVGASEQATVLLLQCGAVVVWRARTKEGPFLLRVDTGALHAQRMLVGASTLHVQCSSGQWVTGHVNGTALRRDGALPEDALLVGQGLSHCTYCLEDRTSVFIYGANQDGQRCAVPREGDTERERGDRKVHHDISMHFTERVVDIASGFRHSLVVDSEGRVHCWGLSDYGQSGVDEYGRRARAARSLDYRAPVVIMPPPGDRFCFVSGGRDHSLALTESGTLLGWGRNTHSQLGCAKDVPRGTAVPVLIANGVAVRRHASLAGMRRWTPATHKLFHPLFRDAVHTLLCVQMYVWGASDAEGLDESAVSMAGLPTDILLIIFEMLAKEHWNFGRRKRVAPCVQVESNTPADGPDGDTGSEQGKATEPRKQCVGF